MNYLILIIFGLTNLLFAECIPINVVEGKHYEFNCEGNAIIENCGIVKSICEFNLNEKLKNYKIKYSSPEKIDSISILSKKSFDITNCLKNNYSLVCKQVNNCKKISNGQIHELMSHIRENIKKKFVDSSCSRNNISKSFSEWAVFSKHSCIQSLEKNGIKNFEDRVNKECFQLSSEEREKISCEVSTLISALKTDNSTSFVNLFQTKNCIAHSNELLTEINSKFSSFLIDNFSKSNLICNEIDLDQKNIDQLICFKAEEFRFNMSILTRECNSPDGLESPISLSKSADKEKTIDPRTNITGQPEKESFTLPTEAPVINNQEALQKIDKLIADNGGEMTPEVAKKAGEIFNSEIYQPTKNFLNSVNQAITGASGTSGRSSSNFESNNTKSNEVSAKTSGVRGVANITEEAPSAARATALNGKIASGGSSMLDVETANLSAANRETGTGNTHNNKKLTGNNFSVAQGISGVGGLSGSSTSTGGGTAGFSGSGSADRNYELPQLPSLSSEEKSEITKVVQALKGAESAEDVKSIVTGEDNYQQVKRIVQELEQSKKGTTSKSAVGNGRTPASAQASSEVKEFEKTLEKFGIKVYGEAGPGKAVYAPTSVYHVIVIKSNSVQFLNTIRSKK